MTAGRSVGDRAKVLAIALLTAAVILGALGALSAVELSVDALFTSGEVTAGSGSLYLDRSGHPTVVGEIDNDRARAIENVTVTVRFVENGTTVGEVETPLTVDPLPGRTAAPFSARLPDTDVDPDDFRVEVAYDDADGTPAAATVVDHEVSGSGSDSVTIVGEVRNEGSDPSSPAVVVTFYDASGAVIGYRTGRTSPDPLRPGETGDFRIRYSTLGDVPSLARAYDEYRIVVAEA